MRSCVFAESHAALTEKDTEEYSAVHNSLDCLSPNFCTAASNKYLFFGLGLQLLIISSRSNLSERWVFMVHPLIVSQVRITNLRTIDPSIHCTVGLLYELEPVATVGVAAASTVLSEQFCSSHGHFKLYSTNMY